MAVQVWIGEKPDHPNERRAIVTLANGLERMESLYLLLANFNVGGRTIDLVVIKPDGIFIIELKHCDGKIFGDVNGPWYVESAGGSRKRLNPGRKNPYNQVISYYYSLTNFLNDHRAEFLSEHKANTMSFRSCRRLVVIAPRIEAGSELDLDWKVQVKGLDELPAFLVTERSPEIRMTEDEMLSIPAMLGCSRWNDVNQLLVGIAPQWTPEPEPAPEPAPEPPPPAPTPTPYWQRVSHAVTRFSGVVALVVSLVALLLMGVLLTRPTIPAPPTANPLAVSPSGPAAGGVFPVAPQAAVQSCIWSGYQAVGKRRSADGQAWQSVGVSGLPSDIPPEVVVTLETVDTCTNRIELRWSVRNNTQQSISFPLTNANITILDPMGNAYLVADQLSEPPLLRIRPNSTAQGVVIADRPVSQNALSLLVRLKDQPFGEASWLVALDGNE